LEHGHFCHQNGVSTGKTSWAQFCFVLSPSHLVISQIWKKKIKKKKFSQIYTKSNPPIFFCQKTKKIVPTLSHEPLAKSACNFHQRFMKEKFSK
jgi:hypothetical protein